MKTFIMLIALSLCYYLLGRAEKKQEDRDERS